MTKQNANKFVWALCMGAALLFSACSSISSSARNGFPTRTSDVGGDCMDFTPLFGSDESNGWGYFFGDIVAMEPLLEGVRYNVNFAHEDDRIGDGHFECSDYGHAALQVTFSNVQASWDDSLVELTVASRANELLDLDTTPVIDPKTHTLAWRTTEGTKATFPGPGVRLGMIDIPDTSLGRATGSLQSSPDRVA